ncbi:MULTISPECIES: VOC family protein [Pseudophaeobacter]|jgi:catechol 2,3-dioxygenase-like lactoylglutathione lyase family enzyme|uniref:VOC family protein n=1 Tax=Pseudophaeobacter TaxID=1541822 RepID=UPI00242FDBC3|nr:VOC family protein [Pseudophaeobacter profundi]
MSAVLEHANITVTDPKTTAQWMQAVFGWHIRWSGAAKEDGFTIHIGGDDSYLALYTPATQPSAGPRSYGMRGGLNHLAVTVSDLDATEKAVIAAGFTPQNHADYEPGRRFYFRDQDEIEYEVVQYDD